MLLIPAIDLKDGQCVRLKQGRMEDADVFSSNVLETATRWVNAGCSRLHMVDLNGAFAGEPVNAKAVLEVTKAFPHLPVQIGGGIRDFDTIQRYLDAGVSYVIIGTKAVKEPEFVAAACAKFPGKILVGLDAQDGMVAINGWAEITEHSVIELAKRFENDGVNAIIYTDIGRDGMLQGVNVEATKALAEAVNIPIIASGGITNLEDIRALCAVAGSGISGAITGRAIYEGSLDFAQGQRLADTLMGQASWA